MRQMTEIFEEIDGYTIIRGFDVCPVDPEATKAAVEEAVRKNPNLADADMKTLFDTCVVYSDNTGPGRKCLTEAEYAVRKAQFDAFKELQRLPEEEDAEYTKRKAQFDALREHQCLTEEAGIIPDFRNTEYWQKAGSRWGKHKIEHIGETVPADGILPDALSETQREEIAAREQADRIAALSPEEKEAEKQARIKAVIHEAAIKKQEAEIEAEVNDTVLAFDPVAWVRERKSEIEALYA